MLMLLALLPFSAFADNIKITPMNASKTYGDADPTIAKSTWFDWSITRGTLPSGVNVSSDTQGDEHAINQQLHFLRVTQGEAQGSYVYTFEDEAQVTDGSSSVHNLLIQGTGQFTIKRKSLTDGFDDSDDNKITFALKAGHEQYVSGTTQLKPTAADFDITVDLAVNSLDGNLVEGTDFVITGYGSNNTVGAEAGEIYIEGRGNYSGTTTLKFEIKGVNIATVGTPSYSTASEDVLVFGGLTDFKQPTADKFTLGTLTAGTDFQIKTGSYQNNNKAGDATVILEGINGYSGEVEATFPIQKLAVNTTTAPFAFTLGAAPVYNGASQKPNFATLTVGGVDVAESDYTLSSLGTNKGNYTAKLTFASDGNFSGAVQNVAYSIAAQTFNAANGLSVEFTETTGEPAVEKTDYTYNNEDIKPSVRVKYTVDAEHVYILTTDDYTVTYKDAADGSDLKSVQDGKKVIVKGKRNFTTAELAAKTYNVKQRELTITTQELTVGMGADVAPVPVYGTFAKGQNASNIGGTAPTYTYTNTSTSTNYSQAQIATAPVGDYTVQITNNFSNTNYTFTVTNGVLHKIPGQVVVQVTDREIEYGDAFPTTGWTIDYVSGLAESDLEAGGAFDDIVAGLDQGKFAFVNTPAAVNANATGYDVNYNNGLLENASYTVTVKPGKLIVKKKAITPAMISINGGAALTYTGAAQYPEVTVTADVLLPTNYSTTVYDESFKAGTRKAKVSMSGTGQDNYITETKVYYAAGDPEVVAGTATAGELKETLPYVEASYTINKVALTITADNFTGAKAWTYGTPEPTYTAKLTAGAAIEGEESLITSLLAGDQPEGFNGKLVVKRNGAPTVGDYAGALVPSFVDEDGADVATVDAADNYAITLVNGNLTIKKGKIIAKVKDITLPWNGTTDPAVGTFQLEAVSGMDEAEAANFDEIVTYDKAIAKFGYTTAYRNIGPHTLAYTGATPTATNYEIELAEGNAAQGTLTVVKRPVTFKAIDKTIDYSAIGTWAPAVNATYVKLIAAGDAEYDAATCNTLLSGVTMANLIAQVKESSKNVGENEIVLTAKDHANYEVHVLPGTLTITSTGVADITLNRVAKASYDDAHTNTAATLIHQNDGKFVNVKFSDFAMIGEKWYPLVLPFATSVKEISKAFGYAVVDTYNGTDANGNITFKLHMGDIDANTPFIVKAYQDMNMSDAEVVFNNVKIVEGTPVIGEESGVQFVGTYTGKIDGFRSNMYYFSTNAALNEYYKGNDTNTTYLRPLGAYFLDNSADAETLTRGIIIEEIDGTSTRISAIAADGSFVESEGWYTVGGVKLEGAPTQKGIYVRNGKKVVIK